MSIIYTLDDFDRIERVFDTGKLRKITSPGFYALHSIKPQERQSFIYSKKDSTVEYLDFNRFTRISQRMANGEEAFTEQEKKIFRLVQIFNKLTANNIEQSYNSIQQSRIEDNYVASQIIQTAIKTPPENITKNPVFRILSLITDKYKRKQGFLKLLMNTVDDAMSTKGMKFSEMNAMVCFLSQLISSNCITRKFYFGKLETIITSTPDQDRAFEAIYDGLLISGKALDKFDYNEVSSFYRWLHETVRTSRQKFLFDDLITLRYNNWNESKSQVKPQMPQRSPSKSIEDQRTQLLDMVHTPQNVSKLSKDPNVVYPLIIELIGRDNSDSKEYVGILFNYYNIRKLEPSQIRALFEKQYTKDENSKIWNYFSSFISKLCLSNKITVEEAFKLFDGINATKFIDIIRDNDMTFTIEQASQYLKSMKNPTKETIYSLSCEIADSLPETPEEMFQMLSDKTVNIEIILCNIIYAIIDQASEESVPFVDAIKQQFGDKIAILSDHKEITIYSIKEILRTYRIPPKELTSIITHLRVDVFGESSK